MTFRGVLFDAAETLFTVRGSVGEIYAAIAREYGSTASPAAVQAAFARNFPGAGPVTTADEKNWWKQIVHRVFTDVGMVEKFDEFFDRVYDQFRSAQGWILFPETREVLETLRRMPLKLGVISNFDSRLYSVLEALGIRDFFDSITVSSEAGYAKPSSEIFRTAVRAMDLPAFAILMVGDHPEDDVAAAERAGLSAVLVDRANRYGPDPRIQRISSLRDVISQLSS